MTSADSFYFLKLAMKPDVVEMSLVFLFTQIYRENSIELDLSSNCLNQFRYWLCFFLPVSNVHLRIRLRKI